MIASGPLFTACEAVLDFGRTPLQPVYEGGIPDSGSSSTSTRDARSEAASSDDSGGGADATDATTEPDVRDSGMDADG